MLQKCTLLIKNEREYAPISVLTIRVPNEVCYGAGQADERLHCLKCCFMNSIICRWARRCLAQSSSFDLRKVCMTFAVLNDMFSTKSLASAILVSSVLCASSGMAQEQPAAGAAGSTNAGAQQNSAGTPAAGQPAPQARVQKFDD